MFHPTAHCLTATAMRQCCVPKRSVARSQRTPRRAERRWCDAVVDRVNCATSPRRWLAAEIRRRRSLPTLPSACGPSTLPLALIDIILNLRCPSIYRRQNTGPSGDLVLHILCIWTSLAVFRIQTHLQRWSKNIYVGAELISSLI